MKREVVAEEGENDTDEGSQGENDAEDDEDSDEEEAGELEASGAAEDSNSDLAEESDEEVADAKEALKKHKVRVPNYLDLCRDSWGRIHFGHDCPQSAGRFSAEFPPTCAQG